MNEGKSRTAPFDIFRTEGTGSVLWIGSAASVTEAKARIRQQSAGSPGEYLLLNQQTGTKLVIKLDETDAAASR
jgi:hypothetical protein